MIEGGTTMEVRVSSAAGRRGERHGGRTLAVRDGALFDRLRRLLGDRN
jgi:hypothetical protein